MFFVLLFSLLACNPPADPTPSAKPEQQVPAQLDVQTFGVRDPVIATAKTVQDLDRIRVALAKKVEVLPENWCLDETAPMGPILMGGGELRGTLPLGECKKADPVDAGLGELDGTIDPNPETDGAEQHQVLVRCAETEGTDAWDPVQCTTLVDVPDGVDPRTVYRRDLPFVYSKICPEDAQDDDPRCVVRIEPLVGTIDPAPETVTVEESCEDLPELCRIPLELVRPRAPVLQDADTVPCDDDGIPKARRDTRLGGCLATCKEWVRWSNDMDACNQRYAHCVINRYVDCAAAVKQTGGDEAALDNCEAHNERAWNQCRSNYFSQCKFEAVADMQSCAAACTLLLGVSCEE